MKMMEGGGGGDDGKRSSTSKDPVPRRRFSVDVLHVRQRFNWDCGLACVLMVLGTLGFDWCDIDDLEKHCFTTSSSWRMTGNVLMCYLKRLVKLELTYRSISVEVISSLVLSGKYVAVALADKIKSSQSWPEDIHVAESCGRSLDYIGHYVVICAYNADSKEFDQRDPASPRKYQRISMDNLDDARKSFGTDEDIILISLMEKNAVIHRQSPITTGQARWVDRYHGKGEVWAG